MNGNVPLNDGGELMKSSDSNSVFVWERMSN
jgi:hypothetical protein